MVQHRPGVVRQLERDVLAAHARAQHLEEEMQGRRPASG